MRLEYAEGESVRTTARKDRWLAAAAVLGMAVVGWEYLLNTVLNPDVDWNAFGLAAHAALDAVLIVPIAILSVFAGRRLGRRLALEGADVPSVLGRISLIAMVFLLATLPVTASRDRVHEWMGTTYGLSLAELRPASAGLELTSEEAQQLCSFGSVRDPAADRFEPTTASLLLDRARTAGRDALLQLAALLPLLLAATARRHRAGIAGRLRMIGARHRRTKSAVRWMSLALGSVALFCFGTGNDGRGIASAQPRQAPINACDGSALVKTYDVHAIEVTITLNRWGDHINHGFMYALEANIPAIRSFEAALEADRALEDGIGVTRVSHGLRKDPIQPLVLRANLGECLRVNFTNDLDMTSSMHILGLAHTASNAGSAVGDNPDSMAAPGQTITYEIPIPSDPGAERSYYFHNHGAGRAQQNMGLFGAIVAEPAGATYLDVETGEPLDTVTGSNWEAIILDPNLAGQADAKSFREFVIFYHEIGDEGFTDIRDRDNKLMPLVDDVAGVYRPAARALNYRSEPFRRRLEVEKTAKSLGYASFPFGDPATPMPRSYVGEASKTRLMHGGSEIFHVHHLHGGGDRWRRNPNADPNNDYWKGLTKVPDPRLKSIHLDSQSIGPGTSYNLEHECGAGGCQQGVGDFLYHCHIGHHYISGMWSFWRVFGTLQTTETNLYGKPLAVVPALFQADNPFTDLEAASNTPPLQGVPAGALIGLTVDDGRTLVADDAVTDPESQLGIAEWAHQMLPPAGVPLDKFDATVWDWASTGAGTGYRVWGPPESTEPFAGYVSSTPGERQEVLFNPKNGRYAYPLFHPQKGRRPPFSARHSGAPWLGEEMKKGRMDGLCARNGVHPGVDVGESFDRFYPISAITLPIQVSADNVDPDGQIFVLNEEEEAIRRGDKLAEPLAIRSNVGDCVEIVFTNKIPDGPLNKNFSKSNMHSHFVQFDTQASDGVITGFSYEQSVRPIQSEDRVLTTAASAGDTLLAVNHTDRLRTGIWLGIGLGEGVCGTDPRGQPLPCTEIRRIEGLTDTSITLDRPLDKDHGSGQAVGVEFVRYRWYSDVDFGTVFFHTHVEFKDWDHGLFGTHIVEPKGSTYHHPVTGETVRAGGLVDVHVDPSAGGNPVAFGVDGSFREFMLFLHNNSPVEGAFTRGGGTINLRAEPWRRRDGDPAYRFSSVRHGDPHTPLVRAYVGDPLVIRGMGLVERVGGIRFTGHRFNMERFTDESDIRDATFIGISERFDVSLQGGAGGPGGYPGDYLYYSTLGKDFESGAWGILRVHDTAQGDLQPLPDRAPPAGGEGFPRLGFTGDPPPALEDGPGSVCPPEAPVRSYDIGVSDVRIVYNDLAASDRFGVAYHPGNRLSDAARTPLVLRANAGDCLRVNVRNSRRERGSFSLGELLFDPQRSYGTAIGYNFDSTIRPGWHKRYEYYADQELGLVLGLNLSDPLSVQRGAFAGVVIEPAGSLYRRPGTSEPLPNGGMGVQADIVTDGVIKREFVALFSDEDRRIGQNTMPYPVSVQRFAGLSYAQEPLDLRGRLSDPASVFQSSLWGDPRYVVTVPAGTPLVFRVGQPWGNQTHVPTLEGHRWLLEPRMAGSEQVYNDVLLPGMSLNLEFVGGAGGDLEAPGDYLFLDRRQPFLEYGLWMLVRVTDDGRSGGSDSVAILDLETSQDTYVLRGRNGLRPAGDTAPWVRVFAGDARGGTCTGRYLGRARVNQGSGAWQIRQPLASMPASVCVQSTAGGVKAIGTGG